MKKLVFILSLLLIFWQPRVIAQSIDSLKQSLIKYPESIPVLNALAHEYSRSYLDSSLFYSRQAINLGLESGDSSNLAESYYLRGVVLEQKSRFDSALNAFHASLSYSKAMDFIKQTAYTLNSLGILHDQLGHKDSSFFYYERCLEHFQLFDNPNAKASVLYNIGMLYESSGNYAQALTKYFESLTIREQHGPALKKAICLQGIAMLYQKQKKYNLARAYFAKAQRNIDPEYEAFHLEILYSNLADLFLEMQEKDSARHYIDSTKRMARTLNDEEGLAFASLLESELEIFDNNLLNALELAKNAYNAYRSFNYPEMEVQALLKQAKILHLLKRPLDANSITEKSLERYKYLNSKDLMRDHHALLADLHEELGLYQTALKHQQLFYTYQDSIYNVQLAGELADLRTKFESEKNARLIDRLSMAKEQQDIELQKFRDQILWLFLGLIFLGVIAMIILKFYRDRNFVASQLEEKNAIIEDALSERELLLKEIHHRVKNNLQIISSLLGIQSDTLISASEVIKTSQDRIQAMALIHEKLYQSEHLNSLNAKQYIESLVLQYRAGYTDNMHGPVFESQLEEITLPLDKLVPIGLILNECITNSIKHAAPSQNDNIIQISFTQMNNKIFLIIADNGSGFDPDTSKSNLGIRLIEGLAGQLNGILRITTKNGTRYNISFPA